MIKNKLKELSNEIKKFKVKTILILDHKKRRNHEIFHPNANLIAVNSDTDEAFQSMHQNIMPKIKKNC